MKKIKLILFVTAVTYFQSATAQVHEVNGKVGIGTTDPQAQLEIKSNDGDGAQLLKFGDDRAWVFQQKGVDAGAVMDFHSLAGDKTFMITSSDDIRVARFHADNDEGQSRVYLVEEGGKVGIGTTNIPSAYSLAVNGGVIATRVKVATYNSSDWADYVFEKEYDLMPLEKVEKFVQENKHLPEVPSATEVEENGVDLMEMNVLLLKKVEELTLHAINIQKNADVLQKKLSSQQKEIDSQRDEMNKLKRAMR